MEPAVLRRMLTRAQIALALCFVIGVGAVLLRAALYDPDVPLLPRDDSAAWIADPMPLHTQGMWIEKARPRARLFERRFHAPETHGPVTLRVRALGELDLTLNGRALDLSARDPRRWRMPTVLDVTPLVAPGENVLRAEVRSARGAALLQLRLDGFAEPIATDPRWLAARAGEAFAPARLAEDRRALPDAAALPAPGPALRANAPLFVALFALGVAAFAALGVRPASSSRAPAAAAALVVLFWAALFATKLVRIPAGVGFDAAGHLEYVRLVLARGTLPLASDGISTYHPPLFHAATAALLALVRPTPEGVAERALLGLLPALSAFGLALVAGRMARVAAPDSPGIEAGAILAAGLLPMNVALGAYVSNEAPHALLASLAILATLRALAAPRASWRHDAAIGALLGAALLTKYTSLLLVPLLAGALALKRLVVEPAAAPGRREVVRAASGAALCLALAAALAGWVYVRNWLHFGDPVVWNLDADPARTWWQLPGFHTPAYFLRFGEALSQPWFAGFRSFWDSVYTTLWGDGLLGGASSVAGFHGLWRLDLMAAGFPLALPATALLVAGWLRVARAALRDGDAGRRLAFSLAALLPLVFLTALVSMNLRLAFWSLGKAFYALCLTPLLAVFLALGLESVDRCLARRASLRAARALVWGWAAAFAGGIALAYLG
jgi:hypothetical protein